VRFGQTKTVSNSYWQLYYSLNASLKKTTFWAMIAKKRSGRDAVRARALVCAQRLVLKSERQGFGYADAIYACGQNATGITCAFPGRVQAAHIAALQVFAARQL
jgi:hypothetical protein